jgi:hypothetical protein
MGNKAKIPRRRGGRHTSAVSAGGTGPIATTSPIDEYLAALDEPKRTALTSLRDTIMAIVPMRSSAPHMAATRMGGAWGIIGPAASGLTPSPELSASTREYLLRWILRARRRQAGR